MERDWGRLGRLMAAERKATTDLSQVDVAQRINVTRTPIQAIERGLQPTGKPFTRITGTMREYARLLGWADGSIEAVLAGGDPTYTDEPAASTPEAPAATGLPHRIAQAIADEGQLLDAQIIPLPGIDEPDGQIIAIVKGSAKMTPEEIRRAIAAWELAQDGMRRAAENEPPQANEA